MGGGEGLNPANLFLINYNQSKCKTAADSVGRLPDIPRLSLHTAPSAQFLFPHISPLIAATIGSFLLFYISPFIATPICSILPTLIISPFMIYRSAHLLIPRSSFRTAAHLSLRPLLNSSFHISTRLLLRPSAHSSFRT